MEYGIKIVFNNLRIFMTVSYVYSWQHQFISKKEDGYQSKNLYIDFDFIVANFSSGQ